MDSTNANVVQVGLGIFGEPYLLIQTRWVEERKFESVEEDFALAEGEESYEEWKSSRIESWKDKKDPEGVPFGNGIGKTVLCERFETVWPTMEEEFP
jgi:uncharacterized protein YhfF